MLSDLHKSKCQVTFHKAEVVSSLFFVLGRKWSPSSSSNCCIIACWLCLGRTDPFFCYNMHISLKYVNTGFVYTKPGLHLPWWLCVWIAHKFGCKISLFNCWILLLRCLTFRMCHLFAQQWGFRFMVFIVALLMSLSILENTQYPCNLCKSLMAILWSPQTLSQWSSQILRSAYFERK